MRIALIGNMNNNNFALMRYFRDLGADADLLLFKGDTEGVMRHFRPENDTWELARWAPHIRQTSLVNGPSVLLGPSENAFAQYRPLYHAKRAAKWLLRRPDNQEAAPSREALRDTFAGYDALVGSGISPAMLTRIERPLDIFYPYSVGIEFLASQEFLVEREHGSRLARLTLDRVAAAQEAGIRQARRCLNAELSLTQATFERLGVSPLPLAVPMVYNREHPQHLPPELQQLVDEVHTCPFSLVSHARQMWHPLPGYTPAQWAVESKHNDWLIRGFAELRRLRPALASRLYGVAYGPDVERTRGLCKELGVEADVRWLPVMPRRELMCLLRACSVGVGEFTVTPGALWGGTAWEVLAAGRPLLQAFNFEPGAFDQVFGHPPPPMLHVDGPAAVTTHLIRMADEPQARHDLGEAAAAWFERHNGWGLARTWLELLREPVRCA